MNRCVLFLLIIATFPLCAAEIISQKIPDSTVVHAPFALEVIIKTAPNEKIIPADTAGWQKTLLINAVEQKTVGSDVKVIYHLAAYAPPICTIPAMNIYVVPAISGGKSDTLKTAQKIVVVASAITDTGKVSSAEFGDPMEAGKFPIKKVLGFLGMVLLAAAVLVGIIVLILKLTQHRKNKLYWGMQQIPPYDEAMEALALIEEKKLIETGELRKVVFLLSEILKRYIGRRYECEVQESTSSEFRKWISRAPLEREQKNVLERFIAETDPMKFANIMPSLSAVGSLLNDVKSFVIDTKPVEISKEEK